MEEPIYHLKGVVQNCTEDTGDFVGPLDLILYLLRKNKIAIEDISISELLDQYMEHLHRWEEMDMAITSDFVAMAAHLMYIKTRMLLSIHDEEAMSEMEQLIRSLEERRCSEVYTRIRGVTETLSAREAEGLDCCTRTPEPLEPTRTYQYSHRPEELQTVMRELLLHVEAPPPIRVLEPLVAAEPYPVARKLKEVWSRLTDHGRPARLRQLFRNAGSRSEIVAVFLAVLELCKDRRIRVQGDGMDCTVSCMGEAGE